MISTENAQKIRHIEIQTRRLLSGALVGDARSRLKGSGFEFDQIREYQQGDDVRFIDWRSSARMNKLLVKEYIEERNRTIMLAVDCSASQRFGSGEQFKADRIAQIAGVLTLVANYGSDNVSLILFSDHVECFIPPARGRQHTRAILEKLFAFEPTGKKTSIACALEFAAKQKRKDAVLFLISDFIDAGFERGLSIASRMYDTVAISCLDSLECALPEIGFLDVVYQETGASCVIDTRKKNQTALHSFFVTRAQEQENLFNKYGVDRIELGTTQP
ncbi:DUF58 domain-containing protein, partial [Methylicorpusculum sp.]|uniref:DUF58 domain-containing protein n=1 Tax=Methylicorpusculum sp. TaxID=2713644 RepID=UPI002AB81950